MLLRNSLRCLILGGAALQHLILGGAALQRCDNCWFLNAGFSRCGRTGGQKLLFQQPANHPVPAIRIRARNHACRNYRRSRTPL